MMLAAVAGVAAPVMDSFPFWRAIVICTLAWAVLLVTLHRLPNQFKRAAFALIAFLCAFFYLGTYFLPAESHRLFYSWTHSDTNWFAGNEANVGVWVEVIVAFTFALGLVNLVMVHGRNISRGRSGWHNSVGLLTVLFAMIFFGIAHTFIKVADPGGGLYALGLSGKTLDYWYDMLFNGMLVPLEGTMFSILAFFIASAAFRAFRMRSGEATVMLVAAFIVMVGQVPLGMMLTAWLPSDNSWRLLRVENLAGWILTYPSAATLRGIGFGVAVGAVAMALRVWLSLERGAIFQTHESGR